MPTDGRVSPSRLVALTLCRCHHNHLLTQQSQDPCVSILNDLLHDVTEKTYRRWQPRLTYNSLTLTCEQWVNTSSCDDNETRRRRCKELSITGKEDLKTANVREEESNLLTSVPASA